MTIKSEEVVPNREWAGYDLCQHPTIDKPFYESELAAEFLELGSVCFES